MSYLTNRLIELNNEIDEIKTQLKDNCEFIERWERYSDKKDAVNFKKYVNEGLMEKLEKKIFERTRIKINQ